MYAHFFKFAFSGAILFCHLTADAQELSGIYNGYDSWAGHENLNLNNGRAYPNPYRVRKGNHQFLDSSEYAEGQVSYDGQTYYSTLLRYDIYHDILVYRPKNISNNIGIILEKDNVADFRLNGRTFVNLNKSQAKAADFVSGYYEKLVEGTNSVLYAKHHKSRRERQGEGATFEEFMSEPNFVLLMNGEYRKANTKNDIIALFPDRKKGIRDFYQLQRDLEKKDPIAFMTALFKYLDNRQNP